MAIDTSRVGAWASGAGYEIMVHEHWGDGFAVGELQVGTEPLNHPAACIGYRLTGPDGAAVAYTGDTDETDAVSELARGVEVLISDCSTPDELKAEGHLTPSLAGRIGREANCKKMVLTHLYPVCDTVDITQQCRKEYQGELLIAEDFMEIFI